MYSQQLKNYIQQAGQISGLDPKQIDLLDQSMSSYLATFARIIGGELVDFPYDPLATSLQLLSLSITLTEANIESNNEGVHYLVAMGFEQSGELITRAQAQNYTEYAPLNNDLWYRLALAYLHYMAGGFRVQSASVLHHLKNIRDKSTESNWRQEYIDATRSFDLLFRGRYISYPTNHWENLLFGSNEPEDFQEKRIFHLSRQIRDKRRIALGDLGLGAETEWLNQRGINDNSALNFWKKYLENLETRGYTNFTEEQIGNGFENWLIPNRDLIAVLPTGSGKTLIGELKTALTLAQGGQTIWISPMRVLIRQVKKDFRRAFRDTGVNVEELPITEDLIPFYTELFSQSKTASVTTPEKLAALLRNRPEIIKDIKLVVLDEAQIIFDPNRGATIEFVLQELNRLAPDCSFVLLSAFSDKREKLTTFISRLRQHDPMLLTSENRPTRRIYGVITNRFNKEYSSPTIQIYPTDSSNLDGKITSAISINLKQKFRSSGIKDIKLAQSIIKLLVSTNVRAVMFVNSRLSANSQARNLAKSIKKTSPLPEFDLARLQVELGRTSIIESTSIKGIAPHHAGLAKLEQYFVERWTQDRVINIVVATPTLAQGVNLPFDLSILTFLKRPNKDNTSNTPVSQTDILNMIGRAGRAGQVSDGLCLLSIKTVQAKKPIDTLNSARRHFFQQIVPSQELIGVSRLLQVASKANISQPQWIYEFSNLEFSEAQTLTSFVLRTIQSQDLKSDLLTRLASFPSMVDLEEEQNEIITQLESLAKNLLTECGEDNDLLEATARTGMPIEILKYYFSILRENSLRSENLFDQVDEIIQNALASCENRSWYINLLKTKKLSDIFSAINKWRLGVPLKQIEESVTWGRYESLNEINVNKFFNHDISLFAQFWGAFAICGEYTIENLQIKNEIFRYQTFVREGVSSLMELEWLNKIGGLDRVLAHKLAENMDTSFIDMQNPGGYIQRQIELWKSREDLIPIEITNLNLLKALSGVLNEL